MKINVLQLIQDSYYPYICGNSTVAYVFSKLFNELKITQYILVDNKHENEGLLYEVDNIPIYNVNGNENKVSNYIRSFVIENDIDVIMMHDFEYPKYMDYIKQSNVCKILVSHFSHSKISDVENLFDLIICFQQADIQKYIELGVNKEKLMYVPHYPYLMFNTNSEYKENSFIYVGRVNSHKQPHLLLPYLNKLNATYTIMGPIDEEYFAFLTEQIKEYNVSNRVTFVKETNDRNLIREILNQHEFFFQGSKSECFSLSLLEALACGLKCVVNYSDKSSGYNWCKDIVSFFYDNDGQDIENAINKAKDFHLDRINISKYINFNYNHDFVMQSLYDAITKALKINKEKEYKTGSMKYKEVLKCSN